MLYNSEVLTNNVPVAVGTLGILKKPSAQKFLSQF